VGRLIVLGLLFTTIAIAQTVPVDNLLGEGVFGLKWTDTLEQARAKYPGGKVQKEITNYTIYVIEDARKVFDVERNKRDTITFSFRHDGKFAGALVTFDDCAATMGALYKYLGEPTTKNTIPESFSGALAGIPSPVDMGQWKGERANVSLIALFGPGPDCLMSILPAESLPVVEATPSDLGLN
jgi:hypothetical protein